LERILINIVFKDDDDTIHTLDLKDTSYFTDSPANALSVMVLAEQLDDNDGTLIQTCQHPHSIFQWDNVKINVNFIILLLVAFLSSHWFLPRHQQQ
jgi:hypothetical protein